MSGLFTTDGLILPQGVAIDEDAPAVVEVQLIEPEVVILAIGEGVDNNTCFYAKDENKLYVCFDETIVDPKLDVLRFNQAISHMMTQFSIRSCFDYTTDPSRQAACRYYVPAQLEINDGAEQMDDYPYDKPMKRALCINPEVNPGGYRNTLGNCTFIGSCPSCNSYAASEWTVIETVMVDNQPGLTTELVYRNPRVPHYRLSSDPEKVYKNPDEVHTLVSEYVESQREQGHEVDIVANNAAVHTKYFESVIAV